MTVAVLEVAALDQLLAGRAAGEHVLTHTACFFAGMCMLWNVHALKGTA